MDVSRLSILALSLGLLASLACAGERAAADPNQAATAAGKDAAAPSGTPGASPAAPAAPAPVGSPPAAETPGAPKAALDPNATAAKVNGVPILVKDVTDAMTQFLRSQGAPPNLPDAQITQVRGMVIDALVGRELLYQKGKADGILPSQSELDAVLADAKKPFPTEEAWNDNLKRQGMNAAAFTEMITRRVTIDKEIKQAVLDKIVISDAEAKKYYDEHPDEMTKPEEVRASHILFRTPKDADDATKAPIRAKAEQTLAKAKAGEDFAKLAKENSEDPGSAPNGGDLGFFHHGQMVGPFEDAAFALTVGQLSGVVETPFGFHIIKVTDKHAGGKAPIEEVSGPLKNFLQQKQAREKMQAYLDSLKATAKVEMF
jgi:peptidyl-prolyl cis-trans isomerase C